LGEETDLKTGFAYWQNFNFAGSLRLDLCDSIDRKRSIRNQNQPIFQTGAVRRGMLSGFNRHVSEGDFLLTTFSRNGHNSDLFRSQSISVDASVLVKHSDSFGSVGEFF
jgi:hypothetical protein